MKKRKPSRYWYGTIDSGPSSEEFHANFQSKMHTQDVGMVRFEHLKHVVI